MRAVYTPASVYGTVSRAYVRLQVGRTFVVALIDTGADGTVLTEVDARLLRLPFARGEPSIGVGGPVMTYRVLEPVSIALFVPRRSGRNLEWVRLGEHTVAPAVIPSTVPMPSLVGRMDVLRHYRFCVSEGAGTFELRPS